MKTKPDIHGMQVDDDLMYCGTESQPFPAYSSLYFLIYLL